MQSSRSGRYAIERKTNRLQASRQGSKRGVVPLILTIGADRSYVEVVILISQERELLLRKGNGISLNSCKLCIGKLRETREGAPCRFVVAREPTSRCRVGSNILDYDIRNA